MAKSGAVGSKLKWALKKWNSFGKSQVIRRPMASASSNSEEDMEEGLHAVYVGKSRRRYLVRWEVLQHPLIRELSERCGGGADQSQSEMSVNVGCEVVLFDHLLWMLDNSETPDTGSLDELVDFYAS